jgi:hypothetical protein
VPKQYGLFHLAFLVLFIALTVFLCVKYRDASEKVYKRILTIVWVIIVAMELYKQVINLFEVKNGAISVYYKWNAFPFQFCSMPLYVLPLIAFAKEGKFRSSVESFTATFVLFAGLAVMFYPSGIFDKGKPFGIYLQSIIHHGLQMAVSAYVLVKNRAKCKSFKWFLGGVIPFAVALLMAMLFNYAFMELSTERNYILNCFYISPVWGCNLPVLGIIFKVAPYPVFLISYVLGFTLLAFLIFIIARLIYGKVTKK